MRFSTFVVCAALVCVGAFVHAQSYEADRVREAGVVLGEIMSAADEAIPASVSEKAEAIAVFPSTIRGAFVIGAQRGRGIISVRDRATGAWSPPAFLTITGGSVGLQIGGQAMTSFSR